MSLAVQEGDFRLLAGTPKRFVRPADSGREVECFFCAECGTRIYHKPQGIGPVVNIKPGTFDETSWFEPTLHAWTSRKQGWVEVPAGVSAHERQPERRARPVET
jgi:hypothetical protein